MIYQQQVYVPNHTSFSNTYHSDSSPGLDDLVFHYVSPSTRASDSQTEVINLDSIHQKQQYYGVKSCLSAYLPHPPREYHHVVDNFLHIYRPVTQFIGNAEQIKQYILEAFKLTTGNELPDDISITISSAEQLQRIHGQFSSEWSNGIQGFSLNKTRQVFVKEGDLDRVMLVVGHEIGHVLSNTLDNKHDEEAKAFAFEIPWMEAIIKHNIANLKDNINLDFIPANNGLHDIAFGFVKKVINSGKQALELFKDLIKGEAPVKM
ncbi:hypothetical protein HYY69_06890 [Candidatus Woesearchaeota archaeon]|nr:hypothetical protein [Candidatus Woesearchaeota archaeon]